MSAPLPPDALRSALLAQTRGVVRRRRVRRRVGFAVLALGLYAIGFATARLVESRPEGRGGAEPPNDVARAVERETAPPSRTAQFAVELPEELELASEITAGAERAELLLRAGDAYLIERGDIERALRCYRTFLNLAPRHASSREESWLLTAMRQNRL